MYQEVFNHLLILLLILKSVVLDIKKQPMVLMGDDEHWSGGQGQLYHDGGLQYEHGQGQGYRGGYQGYGVEEWNREQQLYSAERGGYPDQGYLGMRGTRYPEVLDEGYPAYPSQPGSRGAGTRFLVPEGRTRYQEQEYNYNSELDTSGRYRSYKDSSGDQGNIR